MLEFIFRICCRCYLGRHLHCNSKFESELSKAFRMRSFYIFSCLSKIASSKAADGQDPVPVTFRYEVKPKEGYVTHTFRPKACDSPSADGTFRHQSLGGPVYKDNYDKVIWNKRAALTWEAHTRE